MTETVQGAFPPLELTGAEKGCKIYGRAHLGEEVVPVAAGRFLPILMILVLGAVFGIPVSEPPRTSAQTADEAKAFRELKAKKTDPRAGLPRTLDPNLIKGKDRRGYEVAREIPEVLAQIPCFCGCEAVGHKNLLDCFVDDHAVG